tara:strand:- start:588 stop:764 length:177 start_codon:yes stop_codon:yes gene_type:complete
LLSAAAVEVSMELRVHVVVEVLVHILTPQHRLARELIPSSLVVEVPLQTMLPLVGPQE